MSQALSAVYAIACSFIVVLLLPTKSLVLLLSLASVPFLFLLQKGLKCNLLDGLILCTMWSLYSALLCSPLYLLVGRFFILGIYLPLACIYLHKSYLKPSFIYLIAQTLLWDWPLLSWMRILHSIGRRGLSPFCSDICEYISVGSLPLGKSCVDHLLYTSNIGAVVNLCRETNGPQHLYNAAGIVMLRIPTPDICEPTLADVLLAVKFIASFRQKVAAEAKAQAPCKNRVFIHCKAGRGRSACIAYCYYLSTGKSPDQAFVLLKSRRDVVEEGVRNMRVCARFHALLLVAKGKVDQIVLSKDDR